MKETFSLSIGTDILNCIKGKQSSGWYIALKSRNLLIRLSEITNFLDGQYDNIPFLQRIWHVINNDYTIQKCKNNCGNISRFVGHGSKRKYGCCSTKCAGKLATISRNETQIGKYGVLYCRTPEGKERVKKTNLLRYGVESHSNLQSVKEAIRKKSTERMSTEESKLEYRRKFVDMNKELYQYPYELIDYPEVRTIQLKHHICGNMFNISHSILKSRIKNKIELCISCKPIDLLPKTSCGEGEVFDYIKSKYGGPIKLRTRKIIYPHEIDIFLPELNIAFEYNGDYWHANPEKYGPNDVIWRNKASDVWARDKRKINRCIKCDIKLVIIWESEWKNDRVSVENKIMSMLR